ncbi:MAG: IreB family regulatory phosphoprotein [Lachnospiraceae bacterium]|nr:IreB family regulatory phosphoprotein [Lachnospiraceae bacterium]
MKDLTQTQFFLVESPQEADVHEVLAEVYESMVEKGYNPVNQIVGYIMSGDPTYITSHNSARSLIMKVERDEIVEELLENYIQTRLAPPEQYEEEPYEGDGFDGDESYDEDFDD